MEFSKSLLKTHELIARYITSCQTDEQLIICHNMIDGMRTTFSAKASEQYHISMVYDTALSLQQMASEKKRQSLMVLYSTSETGYEELSDAVEELLDLDEFKEGDVILVEKQYIKRPNVEDHMPDVAYNITENLFENYGEYSEPFLEILERESKPLREELKKTVKEFLKKRSIEPTFGIVVKTEEVPVVVTKVEEYSFKWEIAYEYNLSRSK